MHERQKKRAARGPVSYTHLDVYKRQILDIKQFLQYIENSFLHSQVRTRPQASVCDLYHGEPNYLIARPEAGLEHIHNGVLASALVLHVHHGVVKVGVKGLTQDVYKRQVYPGTELSI